MSFIHFHNEADAILRQIGSRVTRGRVTVLASLLTVRRECAACAPRR